MRTVEDIANEFEKLSERELHDKFYGALPVGSRRWSELHFEIRQLAITAKSNRKVEL